MESKILLSLKESLVNAGISDTIATLLMAVIAFTSIVVIAWLADWITKKIILSFIRALVARSKATWDDILVEKKFFHRLAHFVPTLIVYYLSAEALKGFPSVTSLVQTITKAYAVLLSLMVFNAFLNSLQDIYNSLPNARNRSIKGFTQVVKIIVYLIGTIVILSIIFGKDLTYFFTGMGAMAAVLMLVFKDSILGFVGGVQLAANDMVRIGDWIEMPSRNADGSIIDISLTIVKVQNADMTITTIPTYALVSESFNNWRGMEESGGRRIKRSINIDMRSIRFVQQRMFESMKQNKLLKSFFEAQGEEMSASIIREHEPPTNGSALTNLGIFRKYIKFYLSNHPQLHTDMAMVVRHRQPTGNGLPIEIYAFSKELKFDTYESVQSGIFDHILAVLPEFGLQVYQRPE